MAIFRAIGVPEASERRNFQEKLRKIPAPGHVFVSKQVERHGCILNEIQNMEMKHA